MILKIELLNQIKSKNGYDLKAMPKESPSSVLQTDSSRN